MKQLIAQHELEIPEGITVEVKGRRVRVKGPRGARTPPQAGSAVFSLLPRMHCCRCGCLRAGLLVSPMESWHTVVAASFCDACSAFELVLCSLSHRLYSSTAPLPSPPLPPATPPRRPTRFTGCAPVMLIPIAAIPRP